MIHARLLSYLLSSAWALERSFMTAAIPVLHQRLMGSQAVDGEPIADQREADMSDKPKGLGYIFASGVCGHRLSFMEQVCAGGLSLDRLQADLRDLANDSSVDAILLHLDSPGGTTHGVRQTAKLIRQIREAKPVYAYTDTLMASAAYWIASACTAIYADEDSDVGSIGVYSAVIDYCGWFEANGYKLELFKNAGADYKALGIPGLPLTDKQRELLQADVDGIANVFKSEVREGRGDVHDDTMRGQCFLGRAALDVNLIDFTADSLEEAVEHIQSGL